MVIDQRRQTTPVLRRHATSPGRVGQHFLNEERVDVNQADLQQMQRQHPELLVLQLVGRELAGRIDQQLADIRDDPKLVRSFFDAPSVAYIRDC